MEENFYTKTLANPSGTTLGMEMLRDLLLPSLLGNNEDIMYWSGKLLARKLFLASKSDLRLFFKHAGLGELKLIKSKKNTSTYELSGEPVKLRLSLNQEPDFKLEAGFIAETCQLHDQIVTEGKIDKINSDNNTVTIIIQNDEHSPIQEDLSEITPFSMIEFDKLQQEAQKINSSDIEEPNTEE